MDVIEIDTHICFSLLSRTLNGAGCHVWSVLESADAMHRIAFLVIKKHSGLFFFKLAIRKPK